MLISSSPRLDDKLKERIEQLNEEIGEYEETIQAS